MAPFRKVLPGFTRYKLGVSYIGTNYCGWAVCKAHPRLSSVEDVLQNAIHKFAGDTNAVNFKGSSRTDKGVHAFRNVFQIDLRRLRSNRGKRNSVSQTHEQLDSVTDKSSGEDFCIEKEHKFTCDMIRGGVNSNIDWNTDDVLITDVEEVDDDFDARASAVGRTYMYRILCGNANISRDMLHNMLCQKGSLFQKDRAWVYPFPLDTAAMHDAAQHLIGEQDFSSFRNSGCQSPTPFRNVSHVEVLSHRFDDGGALSASGLQSSGVPGVGLQDFLMMRDMTLVTITIRADAFLQRMVRNIVGVLVTIGRGNRHVEPLIRLDIGRGLEKKRNKQKSDQTRTQTQGQEEFKLPDVREILALKDRSLVKIPAAPPQGLYLLNVHY